MFRVQRHQDTQALMCTSWFINIRVQKYHCALASGYMFIKLLNGDVFISFLYLIFLFTKHSKNIKSFLRTHESTFQISYLSISRTFLYKTVL